MTIARKRIRSKAPATRKLRGPRDPDGTRRKLEEAALKLMVSDQADAFSVLQAARLAGINRGTAYFHFANRQALIRAAVARASSTLTARLFGDTAHSDPVPKPDYSLHRIQTVDEVALFLIQNPALCRVWLLEALAKDGGYKDPLTQAMRSAIERFAQSPDGHSDLDPDIATLMMLGAYLLWPLVLKERHLNPAAQRAMAKRLVNEVYRMSLYGSIRPEKAGELIPLLKRRLAEQHKPARS